MTLAVLGLTPRVGTTGRHHLTPRKSGCHRNGEKVEPPHSVGGNEKQGSRWGACGGFAKGLVWNNTGLSGPTSGGTPGRPRAGTGTGVGTPTPTAARVKRPKVETTHTSVAGGGRMRRGPSDSGVSVSPKQEGVLTPASTRTRLEDGITLSKVSRTRKDKPCVVPLTRGPQGSQSHRDRKRVAGRGWGRRRGVRKVLGTVVVAMVATL